MMSTHNIYFCGEISKDIDTFQLGKVHYPGLGDSMHIYAV